MKRYVLVAAGLTALVVTLPANAGGLFGEAIRHVAGVQPLSAQVADFARIAPKTQVVAAPAPSTAAPAAPTAALVTDSDRQQLLQAISTLSDSSAKNAENASAVVWGLVITTVILGVAASLAGFLKKNVLAGVLSILVTATVGANNTLPFRDDASTYKYVSAESSALLTQAQLELQMTEDHYNHYRNQLQKLATYGDSSGAGSTADLSKFLQALHSPA